MVNSFNPIGQQLGDLINNTNTNWAGVFGTDSFQPNAIRERRNTRNAPLNDTTQFTFSAPELPNLNREQQFQQNERESTLAGQRATNQGIGGAQQLGRFAADQYRQRADIDYQQASRLANMPRDRGNSAMLSTGNQPAFGRWGAPAQAYGFMGGFNLAANNDRAIRDFNMQRGEAATTARMLTEAEAAGDITRARAQADAQSRLMEAQNNNSIDFMNRQASLNAQQSAIDYARQAQSSASQRLSNERIAQIQANANIYGAMFNALSSPGANYRYWS